MRRPLKSHGLSSRMDRRRLLRRLEDRRLMCADILPGDANQDHVFDSNDLVLVFQASQHQDDVLQNSTWETGDRKGDLDFYTDDMVLAFQTGAYGQPARTGIACSAFYIDQHNTHLPHSAFRGQTPDEMYMGTGSKIPKQPEAVRIASRHSRMETNRAQICQVCEEAVAIIGGSE